MIRTRQSNFFKPNKKAIQLCCKCKAIKSIQFFTEKIKLKSYPLPSSTNATLGQKPTYYPVITNDLMLIICEFCEKCDFGNVNFVKNEIYEM